MSFLDECMKNELNFFGDPITQNEVEDSKLVEFLPIQAIDPENSIRFRIIGNDRQYLDLKSSYIMMNIEFAKDNNAAIANTDIFYPINNFMHSIFNKINISFNNNLVATDHTNYATRAYLQTLLNFDKNTQDSLLSASLWKKDTPGKFESLAESKATEGNVGAKWRKELCVLTNDRGSVQLAGRLFVDLFAQDRFFPNNLDVDIELIQNKAHYPFYGNVKINFKIKNISFFARKITLNKEVLNGIEKKFSNTPAIFPFVRSVVKTIPIVQNSTSIHQDNLFLGTIPSKIFLAFAETSAYDKTQIGKNPFHYKHFGINYIALYKNDAMVPSKAYTPDFQNVQITRSFFSLFQSTNTFFNDNSLNISTIDYINGYCIWGFDMSPDRCSNGEFFHKPENGNIRLEVRFNEPIASNITCIVYADYTSILQITSKREVMLKYIV